jgi:hypothetical protein
MAVSRPGPSRSDSRRPAAIALIVPSRRSCARAGAADSARSRMQAVIGRRRVWLAACFR